MNNKNRSYKAIEYSEKYGMIPLNYEQRLSYMYDKYNINENQQKQILYSIQDMQYKLRYLDYNIVLYENPEGAERPKMRLVNRYNISDMAKSNGSFIHVYSPKAKEDNMYMKRLIGEELDELKYLICTPSIVDVNVYIETPKQFNNVDTFLSEMGIIRPIKKPDWDNIGKKYTDMLNLNVWIDDDIVIDVSYDNYSYALVTTNTGYSLMFNASEIPVTQVKSGGVKSIKLKDDFVVSGCMLDDNYEYVLVVTNKGTMKRLKLTDIEISNRAKRGQIILREVKTNPHRIIKVLKLTGKEDVLIKNNNDIDIIKSTSIPIMDRYSTGSSYAKSIMDACIDTKIEDESIYEIKEKKVEHVKKEDISLSDIDKKILTIDDMLKEMK